MMLVWKAARCREQRRRRWLCGEESQRTSLHSVDEHVVQEAALRVEHGCILEDSCGVAGPCQAVRRQEMEEGGHKHFVCRGWGRG